MYTILSLHALLTQPFVIAFIDRAFALTTFSLIGEVFGQLECQFPRNPTAPSNLISCDKRIIMNKTVECPHEDIEQVPGSMFAEPNGVIENRCGNV